MIFDSEITGRASGPGVELCDPVSLAVTAGTAAAGAGTLGTVLSVASTVIGALGSIQQGQAAKASSDYNAQVAEQNAEIARQQTQANKEKQDRERRLRLGANIAGAGASGTGLESFGDVLASNAAQERLDILTIESEGLLKQRDFLSSAQMSRAEGKAAQTAGFIGAGTKLLTGASKVYSPKPKETITWNSGPVYGPRNYGGKI